MDRLISAGLLLTHLECAWAWSFENLWLGADHNLMSGKFFLAGDDRDIGELAAVKKRCQGPYNDSEIPNREEWHSGELTGGICLEL